MNKPTVCLICGKLGTSVWTITSGARVAIADLCVEHGAPMEAVMERAEARPRTTKRGGAKVQRSTESPKFRPLHWTPPAKSE